MIHIFVGADVNNKKELVQKYSKDNEVFVLENSNLNKNVLENYANGASLFGNEKTIVLVNLFLNNEELVSVDLINQFVSSDNTFVLFEDSMLASTEKKYAKVVKVERFNIKEVKKNPEYNVFDIATFFAKGDKIGTWTMYQKLIDKKVSPEEISGILFWKIKTMIINNDRNFDTNDLKKYLVSLVDLYHMAHRGEVDFTLGLEKFILKALSK